MLVRRAAVPVIMGSAIALAACGAAQSPRATPAPAPPVPAARPEEPPQPKAAVPVRTAADHHREFMGGCAKKAVTSPEYCECAWGELRKAVTDEEMSAGDLPRAKADKVKAQVMGACAGKIPEQGARAEFARTCVGTKSELEPYCSCTWTELRKRFSPAELSDDGTMSSERFLAARVPVVKACGTKMPETVSKEAFMKGCTKDASVDAFCGCAWKELRKQASPAEIESGTFDQKTIFAKVDKTCGGLRPAKP